MAQGSRYVDPNFNGGGLFDPRRPGVPYPEPQEGVPYVQNAGLAGDCGCSGVGKPPPGVNLPAERVNVNLDSAIETGAKVAGLYLLGGLVLTGAVIYGAFRLIKSGDK